MPPLEVWLPLLNTTLIGISGLALLVGLVFIKRGHVAYHKRAMLTATTFAVLFLIVYVVRWTLLGSKPFEGQGPIRWVYFGVLLSHMVVAVGIVPLVLVTLRRALRGEFGRHKRLARITLPLWLYVVITGWLVYWMLYRL
jgi:putative membrane protein